MSETNPFANITNTPTQEDTLHIKIYPDTTLTPPDLQTLHLTILKLITPYTTPYIWHHTPLTFTPTFSPPLPHLTSTLPITNAIDDEWFVVYLLFIISRQLPTLSIQVHDSDGEFLLIEAAFHLPRWLDPENSENRVFVRGGEVHIVGRKFFRESPEIREALRVLVEKEGESRASDEVQRAVFERVAEFPEKAVRNVQQVRVRVPVKVAQVLKHEPCLISLAVEGFYDRDIDTMKFAAKMEKFLPKGTGEELVLVPVRMSRAMYAQVTQQKFQAPKCYPMPPMPPRTDKDTYMEAELGMKIACGFEMMYQQRMREGEEGKGSTWEAYRESLEKRGYFQGMLPGSMEYRRLMENAEEYYRKSSLHHRASEILSAPVRRIAEVLALPHSPDDFKSDNVPPSDSDSWLYGGEDELNSALMKRQKEMELYEEKRKQKGKGKEKFGDNSSSPNMNDFDLGDIAKAMKGFVQKVSSYQGAEVPEDRDLKDVEFDVERFMRELDSAIPDEDGDSDDVEKGSSSDMEFDDFEDESDMEEEPEEHDEAAKKNDFMHSYSDVLNDELRGTTLNKSFVRANDHLAESKEGVSSPVEDMDDGFNPVDDDVNLVQSLLDSLSSQQGLPGPASNLLGLMGKQLPRDDTSSGKGK